MGYLVAKTGHVLKFLVFGLVALACFSVSLFCEDNLDGGAGLKAEDKGGEIVSEETPINIEDEGGSGVGRSSIDYEFRLTDEQGSSYTYYILRLVLALVFIVALAYIAIRLMKKSGRFSFSNDDAYLKLVANLNIEQGKSIKVVTLGDRAYIIGVANNNITKIAEVEDKELISSMNLKADESGVASSSSFSSVFSSIFSSSKPEVKVKTARSFDDEFLKTQQERIKSINFMKDEEFNEVEEDKKLE